MPTDPRPRWDDPLDVRICHILDQMREINLDLISFMDGLIFGDERCTANGQIRGTRTQLLKDPFFWEILARCHNRRLNSDGTFKIITECLSNFTRTCTQNICNEELESLVDEFRGNDAISEANLVGTNFERLRLICSMKSPVLYEILTAIGTTTEQQKRNKRKTVADNIVVVIFSMLLYHRSTHNNVVQKFLSVYWVACGISSRAWQLLHVFGLAMSQTWSQEAIGTLTNGALVRVQNWIKINPFAVIHDNINIAYKVSSQRVDHRNHFDNGTAFTVIPLPVETRPYLINQERRAQLDKWEHASDRKTLDWDQIFDALQSSEADVRRYSIFHVIQFLLEHPALSTWHETLENPTLLGFPGNMDLLPHGAEFRTQHWPLRTVKIDESTLEGTAAVVEEVWKQCGFNNPAGLRTLATERLVPWIGDQKSVSLLRGLKGLRGCDLNGFQRMDYVFPLKGWFHEVMALQNQIHHKHLGNNSTTGLRRDLTRLMRIGLNPQSKTSNLDFHDLHELIFFVLQARVLDCWLVHTGCSTLVELADKKLSAGEIQQVAVEIVDNFTSATAIQEMQNRPALDQDEVWVTNALFLRDALIYWEVTRAIKVGDVGRMANTTPTLLLMFVGGGNSNYAFELLEEMQMELNNLTEPEVILLRHHCWLANTSGRRDGFFPLDQLQEHNVRDIKDIYAPHGPNASWDFLGKMSPVIPTLRAVGSEIESQFGTGARGVKHNNVEKWTDINMLLTMYGQGDGMHRIISGRKLGGGVALDVIRTGIIDLAEGATLSNWQASREKYIHSYQQDIRECSLSEGEEMQI